MAASKYDKKEVDHINKSNLLFHTMTPDHCVSATKSSVHESQGNVVDVSSPRKAVMSSP